MEIQVAGLSHHTAPVAVREQLALNNEEIPPLLSSLYACEPLSGVMVLSTCNRTELYFAGAAGCEEHAIGSLIDQRGLDRSQLTPHLYHKRQADAVHHLLRVAAGLDSLALGEPQILGQLKSAYQLAADTGTIDRTLHKLLQHTFTSAKRLRTNTDIGRHPVSVAYAAVRLAEQLHGRLDRHSALLIGAGETIALAAEHLRGAGIRELRIANRSRERAEALAATVGASVIPLSEVNQYLAEADVVVSATSSADHILGREDVRGALARRRHRPMFLVDLAVPRDLAPEINELSDAYLYTVDDLGSVIAENRKRREQAAQEAEQVIARDTEEFLEWLVTDDVAGFITSMRQASLEARDEVLEKALARLNSGEDPEKVVQFLAHTLTNKLMHTPTISLRKARHDERNVLLKAAQTLFGLHKEKGPEL